MQKLLKIMYTRVFIVCFFINVSMKRRHKLWDKQTMICTDYMILFIINGIIIPYIIKNQFYWLKDNHMT